MEGHEPSEKMFLSRIQSIERKRSDMSKQLAQVDQSLLEARADYFAFLNHKAPIWRVPPEVLSLIFLMGWTLKLPDCRPPFEVVVSQVTRRWRAIAINMPKLWDRVPSHSRQPVAMIERYLERSRDLPIDVYIHDMYRRGHHGELGYSRQIDARLQPLIRNVNRWRSLSIDLFYEYHIYGTLKKFRALLAPQLISISIKRCDDSPMKIPLYQSHRIFESGAPALSHLWLENFSIAACCVPPLENLVSVSIVNDFDTFKFWDDDEGLLSNFFNGLSSLTQLSISGNFWPPEEDSRDFGPVVLNSLRSLKLDSLDVTTIFSCISTPNLELLTWDDIVFSDLSNMPRLLFLHSLTITSCLLDEYERNGLCSMMPALKTLAIDEQLASCVSLRRLVDSSEILPELCRIHITLRRLNEPHPPDRRSLVEKELIQLTQIRSIKDWSLTFAD